MKPFDKEPPDSIDALFAQVCRLHYTRAHILLEEIGLYRGQPPLLKLLAETPGMTHSEVAAHLQIAPATVTKMIQRLERAGFVRRSQDERDHRVSRLALTEMGQAVQTRMLAALHKLEAETFAGLTSDDCARLRRLLIHARRNLLDCLEEDTASQPTPSVRPG